MTYPLRRAPGAEKPPVQHKRKVNPRRLVRLTDAQVAEVVDAAAARAVGDTNPTDTNSGTRGRLGSA